MASISVSEEDLSCPVCCEIFKDPVILTCGHSICKCCVETFWKTKGSRECPVCRGSSSNVNPALNLHLKSLCETFRQEGSQRGPLCSLHRSELKLYCEDDKQLVCLVCRDSKLHRNHNFSPIDEAAQERKEELKSKQKELKKKLDRFELTKVILKLNPQPFKSQAKDIEKTIKQEFEKLHQFLRDEEAARIAALREEEKQRSRILKEEMEKMKKDSFDLSDTIKAIEEKMGDDDITFLLNYKSTVERAQCTPEDEDVLRNRISAAQHVGNLKFRVWEKMKNIVQYTPVTLDPKTKDSLDLILSEDLTSVTYKDDMMLDTPGCVLGSEGFNSGMHCWDVDVREADGWSLGVRTEGSAMEDWCCSSTGVWGLWHIGGKYSVMSPSQPQTFLTVEQKPQRIRVQLDWDRGELSFSDPDNNTHLHTFTHTFTERVFPSFWPGYHSPSTLRILPVKPTVTVELR
ncbi:hypothetical protein ACEWY4_022787 [Coilia grayii]|uniref:Zinc-binding protein A33-like n=1 Tax=Coilia grayii TaxID=363190 RepID=A0ABD1J236_9TELE